MKHVGLFLILTVAALRGLADPPMTIDHQGFLTDTNGAVIEGTADFHVALYPAEGGGDPFWQQALPDIEVRKGLYRFRFGDALLSDALTNDMCWLEVRVDGTALTPRQRLLSVPYALRADTAYEADWRVAGLPSGVIMMWSGALAALPDGWTLCNGANGTPDLRDRFVMGASSTPEVGTTAGANTLTLTSSQLPVHAHTGSCTTDGSHTHTASTGTAGSHSHSVGLNSTGSHGHTINKKRSWGSAIGDNASCGSYPPACSATTDNWTSTDGAHTHSVTLNSAGNHSHTVTVNAAGDHAHTVTLASAGSGASIDNRPAFFALAFIMKL